MIKGVNIYTPFIIQAIHCSKHKLDYFRLVSHGIKHTFFNSKDFSLNIKGTYYSLHIHYAIIYIISYN